MEASKNTVIEQWTRDLTDPQGVLALDGRTKAAKKKQAQRSLLIATATDEELEQMAKITAGMFSFPVEQILQDLKNQREELIKTKNSWRRYLGKTANKYTD